MISDCEEGNKQMFLNIKEQFLNGETDGDLSSVSPLLTFEKYHKSTFSNW